jgi:site-specific recombinase XerD
MSNAILHFNAPLPSPDPTVREVVGLYWSLEAKIDSRRSKAPWVTRKRLLDEFVALHGDLHISQCRKAHLKIWIEGNPALKSDWTRGRHCRTIQRVFNWACDDMELVAKNPFRGVRYKKGKRGRNLTEEEYTALLAAAGRVFAPLLEFCRLTGARPGEARTAKWSDLRLDVNAQEGSLFLAEHKTCDVEDAHPREIGLGPAAIELLLKVRRSLHFFPGLEPDEIFLNARGRPWSSNAVCKRIRQLREVLGLPDDAKLYGCRHKFATDAILNGVGIKDLADLLGHSSTQMTEHYLHLAGVKGRLSRLAKQALGGPPSVSGGQSPQGTADRPVLRQQELWPAISEGQHGEPGG